MTGRAVTYEHSLETEGGRRYHVDRLYPVLKGDELLAVGGICHDITDQKNIQLEKNKFGGAAPSGPETGGHRNAGRRYRPRLQQHPLLHHRLSPNWRWMTCTAIRCWRTT
jgi:hypothetical protein